MYAGAGVHFTAFLSFRKIFRGDFSGIRQFVF